jgi:NADH:ubiquinone oxidoreductase subunit 6 (subunit J)
MYIVLFSLIFYIILFFSTLINIFSLLGLLIISINIIVSAFMVIYAQNPLNSLWFFISILINIAIFGLIIGLEFFILILTTLYLGAISIFFLFMIMLLNIKINTEIKISTIIFEYSILFFIFIQLFVFLCNLLQIIMIKNEIINFTSLNFTFFSYYFSLYLIIGQFLYTYYSSLLILLAFFLLIIMIGIIILTQEDRDLMNKKNKDLSLIKNFENCIFLKIIV